MKEMAISKFKATCLAVLDEVCRTREPLRITRFGRPLADIVPPAEPEQPGGWIGAMQGTGTIVGDVVAPASEGAEWDALRG